MELSHLINLVGELSPNSSLPYVRDENTVCTFLRVDRDEPRIFAYTENYDERSWAPSFLKELADKIKPLEPYNISQLLNNKGSFRPIIDTIIAHTSEFYRVKIGNATYVVWNPYKKHAVGILIDCTEEEIKKEKKEIQQVGFNLKAQIHYAESNENMKRFLPAMRTKPFLLLAGISGTGKSQIVKEMAFATCPNIDELRSNEASPGNYCLIEVKPNWHDSTELLGYDSAIKKRYVVTKFVKFVVKAMRYKEIPFFVCLDEMNLAPVEQYFAEFLSVLESRKIVNGNIISEPLIGREAFSNDLVAKELFDLLLPSVGEMQLKSAQLSDADLGDNIGIWNELKEKGLCLPQNLIVIGTVNMDETTHQFSRKVIDRAMTFEMNEADFDSYFEDKVTLDYVDEPLASSLFLARNVNGNKAIEEIDNLNDQFKANVANTLKALNDALEDTPFKIAYRVQNELVLYFAELLREQPEADQESLLAAALDDIMMMKVLPRIEGDDELLGTRSNGTLNNLATFAANLPKSSKKIEEMTKRLERSHFTSFWP